MPASRTQSTKDKSVLSRRWRVSTVSSCSRPVLRYATRRFTEKESCDSNTEYPDAVAPDSTLVTAHPDHSDPDLLLLQDRVAVLIARDHRFQLAQFRVIFRIKLQLLQHIGARIVQRPGLGFHLAVIRGKAHIHGHRIGHVIHRVSRGNLHGKVILPRSQSAKTDRHLTRLIVQTPCVAAQYPRPH